MSNTQNSNEINNDNAIKPQIAKVTCNIWTREEILSEAIAPLTNSIQGFQKSGDLKDKDLTGTIFDPNIFGESKDGMKSMTITDAYRKRQFEYRENNWAYIQFPIPLVQPGMYEKGILQTILGASKTKAFVKVINDWDYLVAVPKRYKMKDGKRVRLTPEERLELISDFNETPGVSEDIKYATKKGSVIDVTLDNSKIICANGTHSPEPIFFINRNIFNEINSNDGLNVISNKELWGEYFQMLPGSYAILDLLLDIDLPVEIKYVQRKIDILISKLLEKTNGKKLIGNKKQNAELANIQSKIKKLNKRCDYLVGFMKNKIHPAELVTDIIPVMPVAYRDRIKMPTSDGSERYTKDIINVFYNDMIEASSNISGRLGLSKDLLGYEEFFKLYRDRNYKRLPISSSKMRTSIENLDLMNKFSNSTVTSILQNCQTKFSNIMMSSGEVSISGNKDTGKSLIKRVSEKTGISRANVLGKRCDDSARSVITVDPNLKLDEIGIPYDILKVHFKNDILQALMASRHISREEAERHINSVGHVYENPVSFRDSKFTVSYNRGNTEANEIYDILAELVKTKRYLAIRYPSLHKWNELGYKIKIVYDQTIHLNPLLCAGYNADFDGDQMSIFLLSLPESIKEVDEVLAPSMNDMDANGRPMLQPSQDMVIGLYILTLKSKTYDSDHIKARFESVNEMQSAMELGIVDINDKVEVLMPHYKNSNFSKNYYYEMIDTCRHELDKVTLLLSNGELDDSDSAKSIIKSSVRDVHYTVDSNSNNEYKRLSPTASNNDFIGVLTFHNDITETLSNEEKNTFRPVVSTVGRFILNEILPQDIGLVNREENPYALEWDEDLALTDKMIGNILTLISYKYSRSVSSYIKDKLKSYGYYYVSKSGISLSLSDINTVEGRDEAIEKGHKKVEELKKKYIGKELEDRTIQTWEQITGELRDRSIRELDDENPLKMMVKSGARGNATQAGQMLGIRGILMDASNNKIASPVLRNFNDGIDPAGFLTSSQGACKGMIDRSSKTADTGDLTRHLTFGCSDVMIASGDCGDREGLLLKDYTVVIKGNAIGNSITGDNIKTKLTPIDNILDTNTQEVIFHAGVYIYKNNYPDLEQRLDKVKQMYKGVKINFRDSKNYITYNIEGRVPVSDILCKTTGEVLFNGDKPILPFYYSDYERRLELVQEQYGTEGVYIRSPQTCKSPVSICARCYGYFFANHANSKVGDAVGQVTAHAISERGTQLMMRTFHTGGVADGDISAGLNTIMSTLKNAKVTNRDIEDVIIPKIRHIKTEDIENTLKDTEELKFLLTNRSIELGTDSLSEIIHNIVYDGMTLSNFGLMKLPEFIELVEAFQAEIRNTYLLNGVTFRPIHFEIVTKQVMSKLSVIHSEDSVYRVGTTITLTNLIKENLKLLLNNKKPILAIPTMTGFASLIADESAPLRACLFQRVGENVNVMSVMGAVDNLTNPMVALSLGNTMPLGKGFKQYEELVRDFINSPPSLIKEIIDEPEVQEPRVEPVVQEPVVEEVIPEVQPFDNIQTTEDGEKFEDIFYSDEELKDISGIGTVKGF